MFFDAVFPGHLYYFPLKLLAHIVFIEFNDFTTSRIPRTLYVYLSQMCLLTSVTQRCNHLAILLLCMGHLLQGSSCLGLYAVFEFKDHISLSFNLLVF